MDMDTILQRLMDAPVSKSYGTVSSVLGLLIEVGGMLHSLTVGSLVRIARDGSSSLLGEVVGFRNQQAQVMPFGVLDGVRLGAKVELVSSQLTVAPHHDWLGRVFNALGHAIDQKPQPSLGEKEYSVRRLAPPAHARRRVSERINLGIKSINTFVTCCRGQRMGIFSGSGVGKSVTLGMMAKFSQADVNVIGLIGERGREVQEFITDILGQEGMKKSILVVATSDESALMRKQAAYLTMAIAEYFSEQNLDVLCMLDSVTRFAMAQREIGLSSGEPPTTKGYTPTVFSELPKLLERAGPSLQHRNHGNITGLFTVLVDGDDLQDPIADSVRSILDGHIVLDRAIAERARYPAVNVLKSLSRTVPNCYFGNEAMIVQKARRLISLYEDMVDMIRLGAYKQGSDPDVDDAISFYSQVEDFLRQYKDDNVSLEQSFAMLEEIVMPFLEAREKAS